MDPDKPIFSPLAFIKGFLSGSLLAGAFILQASIFLKLTIFIFGFLVILDSIFPSKEEDDYPLISLLGLVVGFVAASLFSAAKLDIYVILIILVAFIFYIIKTAKRIGLIDSISIH